MKQFLSILAAFILGGVITYVALPSHQGTKQVISIDSEKNIPARDMVSQYQKFYRTFESFENWDPSLKAEYLEQNNLTEAFTDLTRQYFKESVKAGKSIQVEEIK